MRQTAPADRYERTGEYRQLTVLFCDLVGSTALSESLDPEDLRDLLIAYHDVCDEATQRHGGHVAEYLGDGVIVYFGYPQAHEDDAVRAVRCGLEVLERMLTLGTSERTLPNPGLEVRVAAHTGRVLVGGVGASARRDHVVGSAPNIAARIQSELEAGTLGISDTTAKMVQGSFTLSSLGLRTLKGLTDPVHIWSVEGSGVAAERTEYARPLTPFVGREYERRLLQEAWSATIKGGSRFMLVRGEPGIGKSRLTQTVRDAIATDATNVLTMRTSAYSTGSPFRPLLDVLEERLELQGLAPEARLERVEVGLRRLGLTDPDAVVLVAALLGVPYESRYAALLVSPSQWRTRTMEVLVDMLKALAGRGPTLLIAEDIHWADTATVEFLDLLVARADDVPLLGVFTTRSDLEREWLRPTALQVVELARFSRPESEAIVRHVAGRHMLRSDVVRQIVSRCEGVPLFAEELTTTVLDSAVLAAGPSEPAAVAAQAIPTTVDASLAARIDRLGSARSTAQLAATIGRDFTFDLLCDVSDRAEDIVRRDLEEMRRVGVAWPTDEQATAFVFKHGLIRDAAYSSLLRSTRQAYHARIATALRRDAGAGLERPDLIAHHLTQAGERPAAIEFWEAASGQALKRHSVFEAAQHLRQAIACLHSLPQTHERLEHELNLQSALAPLLATIYGWGSVEPEQACEAALKLAVDLELAERTYPPLWGLWTVRFLRGQMNEAMESATRVMNAAAASGDPTIQITGRHATSFTHLYRAEFRAALEEADAGLALFDFDRELEIVGIFSMSSSVCLRTSRADALWMLGEVWEADMEQARMVQLGRDLQHPPSLASALCFALQGGCYRHSYSNTMPLLRELADELLVLAAGDDFLLWHAAACACRGAIAQAEGAHQTASRQMREGLDLFAQTGSRVGLVFMNVICAEAFLRMAEEEHAIECLDTAETEAAQRNEGLLGPEIWRLRGRLAAYRNELAQAEHLYTEALERAHAQEARSLELRAALDLYELQGQTRSSTARARLAAVMSDPPIGLLSPEQSRAAAILRTA